MDKKEKRFNEILDACLDRVLFQDLTIEQCLKDHPGMEDDLRPLLEASVLTSQIADLKPREEFRSKARAEFHTYMREAEEKKARSFFNFGWTRRMTVSLTAVVLLFAVVGGTAAASLSVMPDSILYPVKRVTEQVQLAFTFSTLGKTEAYARLADERIDEIVYMATNNDSEDILLLADSLNSNLVSIAALNSHEVNSEAMDTGAGYFAASSEMTESADVQAMTEEPAIDRDITANDDAADTAPSLPALPEADTDEATDGNVTITLAPEAAKAAFSEEEQSYDASGYLTDIDSDDPQIVLNNAIITQATSNINKLYELLEVVPESVKPVVLRAIELSKNGYDIAINSLFP